MLSQNSFFEDLKVVLSSKEEKEKPIEDADHNVSCSFAFSSPEQESRFNFGLSKKYSKLNLDLREQELDNVDFDLSLSTNSFEGQPDQSDSVSHDTNTDAGGILPTIRTLQSIGKELRSTADVSLALRDRLAASCLSFGGALIEEDKLSLFEMNRCKLADPNFQEKEDEMKEHDANLYEYALQYAKSLQHAEDTQAYLSILSTLPRSFSYPLSLHARGKSHSQMLASHKEKDTRHQDCRDIERDRLRINGGKVISGAELKYEGVVALLVEDLKTIIEQKTSLKYYDENENVLAALSRFSRVLLNIGNRTNSGGEAYEAIMVTLGVNGTVLITPNSNRADPVEIDLKVGIFECEKDDCLDWGICARLSGTTYYNITDTVDVEVSHGEVTGRFEQFLGMSLPVPKYFSNLAKDDGKSILNREDYFIRHNKSGSVYISIDI